MSFNPTFNNNQYNNDYINVEVVTSKNNTFFSSRRYNEGFAVIGVGKLLFSNLIFLLQTAAIITFMIARVIFDILASSYKTQNNMVSFFSIKPKVEIVPVSN